MCGIILLDAAVSWFSFVREANAAQHETHSIGTCAPTVRGAHVEMQRMVRAALDAVTEPRAEDSRPLIVDDVRISPVPCGEQARVLSADLSLSTSDPTAAVDILSAWDDAG